MLGPQRGYASNKTDGGEEYDAMRYNRADRYTKAVSKEIFSDQSLKNEKTFKDAIDLYNGREARKRGAVEFINAALKHMKEYDVHKNLDVYKALIDIMPKGKYVPENLIQADFSHYPKQQDCIVELLDQMSINGVVPDEEVFELLMAIFGRHSDPMRKYSRMRYWMPKLKHLSPFPTLPDIMPKDPVSLAEIAVTRISSIDPLTEVKVFDANQLPGDVAVDKTWIVSGQSQEQRDMIKQLPKDKAIYVEGGFRVWLRDTQVTYFILRGEPALRDRRTYNNTDFDQDDVTNIKLWMYGEKDERFDHLLPEANDHEQEDGTILAVCATGTSSRDSLLSWVRFLQEDNPELENIPILFTLQSPQGTVVPLSEEELNGGPASVSR